tara:strand:+ start:9679 stop:10320 length:642 start_codon:yes stop_codon:yes gene_type:complete
MPYRPQKETNNGKLDGPPPWLGFQDAKILSFEDMSSNYEWADVYLIVEIKTRNSEYSNKLRITGSFEKDNDVIQNSSLLRKLYSLFDALSFGGGISKEGAWVNRVDEPITDIANFLNNNYTDTTGADIYPFTVYVYKTEVTNKNTGEKNVYTRVDSRIAKSDNPKAVADLKSYIEWAKKNEVIVEYNEKDDLDFLKNEVEESKQSSHSPSIRA